MTGLLSVAAIAAVVVTAFVTRLLDRSRMPRAPAAVPPVAPAPPPITGTAPRSRWDWLTALVAVATLAIAVVQLSQTFVLNRSQLEVRATRVVDIEPASGGHDLVLAVTLRNLGGMPATVYQAGVRATGSSFYPSPTPTVIPKRTFPFDKDFKSNQEPFDKLFGLSKELTDLKAVGIEPATIVDLSPEHAQETLPAPIRVEARDVKTAPVYLRLRVETSSLDELKRLAQQRGEAVWIDLYDEEDRPKTITVWDCSGLLRICSGVLFP